MKKLLLLVVVTAAIVTSCNFFRIGLRYAEWMIVREASKTFDLNDDQRAKLKAITKAEFTWIKQNWIPGVISASQELDQRWADGLSVTDHIWFEKEWVRLRESLGRHALPEIAKIAVTISTEQLGHGAIAFGKRNEKWGDLLKLTDEKLEKKRKAQLEDSIEDWYGGLTDIQIGKLCEIFGCVRKDVERILDGSLSFQGSLLELIRDERDEKKWSAKIIEWTVHPELMLPVTKRSSWLEFRKEQPQRLARLDEMMTLKQRSHAREKLRELIEDLKWFTAQGREQ